jgi:hypothetical protein
MGIINTLLEYSQVKCYLIFSVHMWKYPIVIRNINKHFWHVVGESNWPRIYDQ